MVAHLSWATWAICLRLLISSERPERFAHGRSFVLSDLSESLTVAHLIWAKWANERMSKWAMSKWANSQPCHFVIPCPSVTHVEYYSPSDGNSLKIVVFGVMASALWRDKEIAIYQDLYAKFGSKMARFTSRLINIFTSQFFNTLTIQLINISTSQLITISNNQLINIFTSQHNFITTWSPLAKCWRGS